MIGQTSEKLQLFVAIFPQETHLTRKTESTFPGRNQYILYLELLQKLDKD